MQLVNETGQPVSYFISFSGGTDCGKIDTGGLVDLPGYDNQTNVVVEFLPVSNTWFNVTIPQTQTGNQVEMALVVK
jgi:hypothetical protein